MGARSVVLLTWLMVAAGCHPNYVPSSAGARLRVEEELPPVAGMTPAPSAWPRGAGLPAPVDECSEDAKVAFERELDLSSVACSTIALRQVQAIGNGDEPITARGSIPVCYRVGRRLLVVEYGTGPARCPTLRRIVGMALFESRRARR